LVKTGGWWQSFSLKSVACEFTESWLRFICESAVDFCFQIDHILFFRQRPWSSSKTMSTALSQMYESENSQATDFRVKTVATTWPTRPGSAWSISVEAQFVFGHAKKNPCYRMLLLEFGVQTRSVCETRSWCGGPGCPI
jgi:hypothetical protein